ncbi:glycosyltransferase [Nocardioides pacificus]
MTGLGLIEPAAAIVVHHRSLGTLRPTLENLIANGIAARRIVVVDNSEDAVSDHDLSAALPHRVTVRRIPNRGYANAVNHGMEIARSSFGPSDADAVLVVTHEVQLAEGSVRAMLNGLESHQDLAAVGPVLRGHLHEHAPLWSAGGRLTRVLRLPRHLDSVPRSLRRCDWLDGAAVMYRWAAVKSAPLSESYFLYMEEVDYHRALSRAFGPVAIEPAALASQTSSGMPAYWACRNIQIFAERWGRPGFRNWAIAVTCGKVALRAALKGDLTTLREAGRGYRAGRSSHH